MSALSTSDSCTWRLDLQPDGPTRDALEKTCLAYARACEHVLEVGRREDTTGNVRLHTLCYRTVREQYALSANLAIRAIARAAGMLKLEGRRPVVPDRIDYDPRILTIFPEERSVSLASVDGRLRNVRAQAHADLWPDGGAFMRATLLNADDAFILMVWGADETTNSSSEGTL